jgi:hypothetical protein
MLLTSSLDHPRQGQNCASRPPLLSAQVRSREAELGAHPGDRDRLQALPAEYRHRHRAASSLQLGFLPAAPGDRAAAAGDPKLSRLPRQLGRKNYLGPSIDAVAVPAVFVMVWLSLARTAAPAVMDLIPDRQMEEHAAGK